MNFYDNLERYGQNTAIITEDGEAISYQGLIQAGDAAAAHVEPRSLIFLVCDNSFAAVAAYVGFLRQRVVPVLVNPSIDGALFSTLLESYCPNFICCPAGWKGPGAPVHSFDGYELRKNSDHAHRPADELALLLTTSGSTGSPKLVRQSYANIDSNAASIAGYLGIVAEDRAITTMPMSYTYGLSIIQSHLLEGAAIIVTESTLMDKRFWSLLKEQGATTFGGVPYIYEMLKRLRFDRMELPSLRYLTQAGGALSKELSAEFSDLCDRWGMQFIVMYGQAEATARMTYLPWEYARSKAGSIGIAIPGGALALLDVDGKEIAESGVTGELLYRGDNVTLGYAEGWQDLSKGDENHGELLTGDMAQIDRDGFYYIVGRKKRFLKLFGNRVNLDEVERILKSAGYNCACGGVDDHLKIYIADQSDEGEVRSFISAKTGLNPLGFTTTRIPEIPRNSAGKVLYSKLEEMHG